LKEITPGLWSGSYPTFISHQALGKLCSSQPSNRGPLTYSPSPLEQFLGATIIKRHVEKSIKEETSKNNKTLMLREPNNNNDSNTGVTVFQSSSLTFQCSIQNNPQHPLYMRQVYMKALPHQQPEIWNQDDLRILEKYFEYRIALSPYRYNAVKSFFIMIGAAPANVQDFIQLMKRELQQSTTNVPPNVQQRWLVRLCLTVPPRIVIGTLGTPANLVKDKILIFVQLTQNNIRSGQPPTQHNTPATIVVPLLLVAANNTVSVLTQVLDRHSNTPSGQYLQQINAFIMRYQQNRPLTTNPRPLSTVIDALIQSFEIQTNN